MNSKTVSVLYVFVFILSACNLPTAQGDLPESPPVESGDFNDVVIGTTVALTTSAKMTELAAASVSLAQTPTVTPTTNPPEVTPTQCLPTITANVAANIRSGPGTVYEIISFLPQNGSTTVAGRDAENTWWYVLLPGKTSEYGWISGSVVTASCMPETVQIVAAPPTPEPTEQPAQEDDSNDESGTPDLVATGFQYSPDPARNANPIDIMVRVKNNGDGASGSFSVAWLSNQDLPGCTWTVDSLVAGGLVDLVCQFTYNGNATADYTVTLVVDTGNSISESNEGNNSKSFKLKVRP